MTIEKAIELLKAGRYNEVKYLEAKNMAVKALEKQSAKSVSEPDSQADMRKVCPECSHFVERYEKAHGNVAVFTVISDYKDTIEQGVSANQAFSNVNLALKRIDFLSLLIAAERCEEESAKKEFQKALWKLISMNEAAEEILEICEKTEQLMLESGKGEKNGN